MEKKKELTKMEQLLKRLCNQIISMEKKKELTKTEQLLKRLCNQIMRNKFNDLNYRCMKGWWGLQLQTMPIFCSYGTIGYEIMVFESDIYNFMRYTHTHTIRYDWELKELLVDGEDWKEYFGIS